MLTVLLMSVSKLFVVSILSVVVAAFPGEAMCRWSIVGGLLFVRVTCVVLSMAVRISPWVMLVGRFRVMFVFLTVLTSVNMQVGLSLEIVAMVLRSFLLLSYRALLVVVTSVLVCVVLVLLMLGLWISVATLVLTSVGAPGTVWIMVVGMVS